MITVHHLNNSRSHRLLWLLEELGLEYRVEQYMRNPKTMRAPKSLRDIHPLGKAPVVTLEDGTVLAESGAIIEELVEMHGPALRPDGEAERRRYRFFMHYAEGSMMPPLLVKLIFNQLRTKVPFLMKPLTKAIANKVDATFTDPEIRAHLSFLDGELKDRQWCVSDDFTAADIQLFFPVEAAESRFDLGAYPKVKAYLERGRARDGYKTAVEKGGALELGS